MKKFRLLTRHIEKLRNDKQGEWEPSVKEKDGTYTMPYVNYPSEVLDLSEDLYKLIRMQPELLSYYNQTNVKLPVSISDIEKSDAMMVVAILIKISRADRFAEGTLLENLKNGVVLKCLERLDELDEEFEPYKTLDKIKGCIYGGAIGDALGYPIEFVSIDSIKDKYGASGVEKYVAEPLFSDDTQMTLFTANAVMNASLDGNEKDTSEYVYRAYVDWMHTQYDKKWYKKHFTSTWIASIDGLYEYRAPGSTCLSALASGQKGTIENPLNDSKGCGGVMRVAPFGLFSSLLSTKEVIEEASKAAAITHGHPMGYISAGMLADIVNKCSDVNYLDLKEIILSSLKDINEVYKDVEGMDRFNELMNAAIEAAENGKSDVYNIANIGQGWVGEEALAIAIYCSLRYADRWGLERGVIAAINHSGDSDSTGAIAGNILGAYLGYDKIHDEFKKPIELSSLLDEISEDLYKCYKKDFDKKFIKKYRQGSLNNK